ncbi:prolyl oligopeptidase family serine peptidase [Sphingomonas sp. DG1-23]|uniref:alpha/beta hydrolase family protein n=1 Tax=Sphingomonas sp. DG1-23 TaxID=3068316 RepID=UPI00273F756E|nr:alpha/beta fold hydrolase [Sphingomonas sp. DG1-23]MDP5280561.1 prolyl oligopeptidase family serine peptidase [Sphingomonas sp. DG1-23]
MLWRFLRGAALAFACVQSLPASAASDASPADAAAYFAPPAIEDAALSPDGLRVAARALVEGRPRLAIFDLSDAAPTLHPVALPEEERLEWHGWLGPRLLLVSLLRQGAAPSARFVTVDLDTGKRSQLGAARPVEAGDEVLHIAADQGFLLLKSSVPGKATPGVYRLDLATGAVTLAVAPQEHVWDWVADSAGVIRAGLASQGKRAWLLYRKSEHESFSRSARAAGEVRAGVDRFVPIRGTDRGYALAQTPAGRVGLYAYDFGKGRLGALLYADSRVDLDGFQTGPDGRLLGVDVSADRPATHWLDPALAQRQARIDSALPGRANRVIASSADQARSLVFSESAADPGAFYLYAGGRATLVGAVSPTLAVRQGAEMKAVQYRARDGLAVSGYLTLPAGREAKGLPLVVMPHGGPFARDSWGYDPWVQYLADRGYAVLQPNYRGSTGFGRDLVEKGNGEWGRGMQNDVDDGADWLVAQGIADPRRICIMGASYGGYAAMWAATAPAPRYRCAISFAGISDVAAQLAYDRKTFEERDYRAWKHRIQGSAPSLDALSPIARVDALRMPILIAHGTADDTVPADQSARLHAALTRLGRAHDYVAYQGQGHTLEGPADNADFLTRVGKFLDAHNPAWSHLPPAR